MARLPFFDTHVHFWDLSHPKLHYAWLKPGLIHPIIGDIESVKLPLYGAEQFITETSAANVAKVLHVEADVDAGDDPVDETIWLEQQARRTGIPTGIIADTNLKAPELEREIERHLQASARVRGFRDFSEGNYLEDADFARGFALLGKHGLVCDLDCVAENMAKARDLANRYPDTTVVVDHAGFPRERSTEYFNFWKHGIDALAQAPSVWCKISGLAMCDHDWTVASIRPWFEYCLEAFGTKRCVLGTNWPLDRAFSSYEAVLDAYQEIVSTLTLEEQSDLFFANAERLFEL
jgi:predicted TIM-barrel fold metal-dependent hydrolase